MPKVNEGHHCFSAVFRIHEAEKLKEVSKRKDVSKAFLIRRALNLYYKLEERTDAGEKFFFLSKDGVKTELIVI